MIALFFCLDILFFILVEDPLLSIADGSAMSSIFVLSAGNQQMFLLRSDNLNGRLYVDLFPELFSIHISILFYG